MLDLLTQPITLEAVREASRIQARNKIKRYYPDKGPLRRELYVKHQQFFKAGLDHMERLACAANRCITPWTPIETDHATRQCVEMIGETGFDVRSWDGNSRCTKQASAVFLKGIEPAFLIRLDNGQAFQVSGRHRILMASNLGVDRPSDWVSIAQLTRLSSGLHCRHISEDSRASCDTGDRPDGEQPLPWSVLGLSPLPLGFGAPDIFQLMRWPVHEAASRSEYKRAYQEFDRPSIQDDPNQISDLCGKFSDQEPLLDAQWSLGQRQALRQFAAAFHQRRSVQPIATHQWALSSQLQARSRAVFSCVAEMPELNGLLSLIPWRLVTWFDPQHFCLESLDTNPGTWIFFPLLATPLFGGNTILSIEPLGLQPILDFEVKDSHCYEVGGVLHHNSGKTEGLGAYETTLHLTGKYPPWWEGRRFNHPVSWWAAGKTGETTRDIVQAKLLGKIDSSAESNSTNVGLGTGMIPADCIVGTSPKQGIPKAIDTAWIRHVSGGISDLGFKSYGKDRDSFEGTEKHGVWLDEEPPMSVKSECLMRLMTNNGILMITFTPLEGYTDVVNEFLEATDPDKWYIQIGWSDVPHLTKEMIAKMSLKYLPYELKARSEGIPSAGEGVIYPIDPEDLTVDDFQIPAYWPRAFGMDVGKTAVIWGALDRDTDTLYLYREYYSEVYNALIHAAAIKGIGDRDKWIPGVVDPGSLGSSQVDGEKLFEIYTREHGLNLIKANNSVEAGIHLVWERMCTGRLKVFRSLQGWRSEFSRYRRHTVETKLGERTQVVKKKDHRMDAMRYLVTSGIARMKTRPIPKTDKKPLGGLHGGYLTSNGAQHGWMGN